MTNEELRAKFYQLMGDSIETLIKESGGAYVPRKDATTVAYDAIENWLVEHPEYRGLAERLYRETRPKPKL